MRKFFGTCVVLLFLMVAAQAQFVQIDVRHDMSDNLVKNEKSRRTETLLVPVPDGPSVKMAARKVVPEADSIYSDADGVKLSWSISKHKKFYKKPPSIHTKLLVRKNTWYDFVKQKYSDPPDPDTSRHLLPELKIQSEDEVIVNFARSLKATGRFEKVSKIYHAIVQTKDLDLTPSHKPGSGAIHAIKEKTGRTYDYAALMTALCRASGIPARFVSGFTFEKNAFNSWLYINHWAEVYFPQMGWVTFDPAGADIQQVMVAFECSDLYYVPVCYGTQNGDDVIRDYYKFSSKLVKSIVENSSLSYYIDAISEYRRNRGPKMEKRIDSLLLIDKYDINFLLTKAMMRTHAGDFENGLSLLQLTLKMAESEEEKSRALFCMARYFALKGEYESAIRFLEKSFDKSTSHYTRMLQEPDLEGLRKAPEFQDFMTRINRK